MMMALKTYKLYGENIDLAKKVLARIKKFEININLGNNLKITVDKHGYNVNELPQDMKDDLKTYEGVSQNMVETLKNYEKLSQHIKDGLKTKQKLKKWVWFDETRNELHDKNHEGENGDNIVNKGGLDGKTEDNIVTNESQIRFIREQLEEFNRKMELGRCAKLLVDEHGYNVNGLDNDMKEALKTCELVNSLKKLR